MFAEWFFGKISVPHGELLKSVHNGYGSVYENDMFLIIEKGVLVDKYEISNEVE